LKDNKDLGWNVKLGMCLQVVSGLQYLHKLKLYHRDLKGENILIVPTGSKKNNSIFNFLFFIYIILYFLYLGDLNGISYTCKISDFGLSLLIDKHKNFGNLLASSNIDSLGNSHNKIILEDNEVKSVGTWFIRAPEVDTDPKYKADKVFFKQICFFIFYFFLFLFFFNRPIFFHLESFLVN
jgi:serine/threonine protein kinase